jgi:hypothetical protein
LQSKCRLHANPSSHWACSIDLQLGCEPRSSLLPTQQVLDSHAWLAGISTNRPYAQRMQHDVDIEAGYMHAG